VGGVKRRVLKFGGTSVGSPEPLRSAVGIVKAACAERPVVVVVSALAGVTDALAAAVAGAAKGGLDATRFVSVLHGRHLALLDAVAHGRAATRATTALGERVIELEERLRGLACQGRASEAARAAVVALGERLSAPLAAAALRSHGIDARAVDAAALVRTNDAWAEAAVDRPATRRLVNAALAVLPPATVPVVTGFIGGTENGDTTLLGRGGSDLTAAIFGWALEAERVEIWSDVDGVLSADPRVDSSARPLPQLSFQEAADLARRGAKVLHPRMLEPLEPAGIPVFVGNTLRPQASGTWIGLAEARAGAKEEGNAA
jgi:aspartate kinase